MRRLSDSMLDSETAKPLVEWVRDQRESIRPMSSQSMHDSRRREENDGEDIRMTQSDREDHYRGYIPMVETPKEVFFAPRFDFDTDAEEKKKKTIERIVVDDASLELDAANMTTLTSKDLLLGNLHHDDEEDGITLDGDDFFTPVNGENQENKSPLKKDFNTKVKNSNTNDNETVHQQSFSSDHQELEHLARKAADDVSSEIEKVVDRANLETNGQRVAADDMATMAAIEVFSNSILASRAVNTTPNNDKEKSDTTTTESAKRKRRLSPPSGDDDKKQPGRNVQPASTGESQLKRFAPSPKSEAPASTETEVETTRTQVTVAFLESAGSGTTSLKPKSAGVARESCKQKPVMVQPILPPRNASVKPEKEKALQASFFMEPKGQLATTKSEAKVLEPVAHADTPKKITVDPDSLKKEPPASPLVCAASVRERQKQEPPTTPCMQPEAVRESSRTLNRALEPEPAGEGIVPARSDEDFRQPELMPTTTEDTDESNRNSPRDEGSGTTEAISYLLRYEAMFTQQEDEESSTIQYILPLLRRLETLSKSSSNKKQSKEHVDGSSDLWKRSITYVELKRALTALENGEGNTDFLTQDSQLMMVLHVLTKRTELNDEFDGDEAVSITWAEIIHCYRICILGMLTLKHLPKQTQVRSRAKERILSQLSLFEMPAQKLMSESGAIDSSALDAASRALRTCGESHAPKRTGWIQNNRVIAASACICALGLAFTAGMMFHPSRLANGVAANQASCQLEDGWLTVHAADTMPVVPPSSIAVEVLNTSKTTSSSSKPVFPPARERLLSNIQQKEVPVQQLSEVDVDKEALVPQTTNSSYNATTVEEEKQPSTQNPAASIWKSIPQGQQLAVSAVVGASVGVYVPPKLMMVARVVGQSLSLGNIGIVPASLVVVGVLAIAANVAKGIRFLVQRFVLRKQRGMA
ncbi:expressed unknown protein [Seminavis robusta]|uniref:Transmembrane protein n=1 Tax=Seminavis robusta TaxID=568900 RepID=A0A9N8HKE4_9STRA|nr:expressed unknown protein [Seminavis robusta]|eukprot:Sro610_g175120.1 n/a (930) ;mRNA; r:20412-23201